MGREGQSLNIHDIRVHYNYAELRLTRSQVYYMQNTPTLGSQELIMLSRFKPIVRECELSSSSRLTASHAHVWSQLELGGKPVGGCATRPVTHTHTQTNGQAETIILIPHWNVIVSSTVHLPKHIISLFIPLFTYCFCVQSYSPHMCHSVLTIYCAC